MPLELVLQDDDSFVSHWEHIWEVLCAIYIHWASKSLALVQGPSQTPTQSFPTGVLKYWFISLSYHLWLQTVSSADLSVWDKYFHFLLVSWYDSYKNKKTSSELPKNRKIISDNPETTTTQQLTSSIKVVSLEKHNCQLANMNGKLLKSFTMYLCYWL